METEVYLSRQEIYDRVVRHLLTQKVKSKGEKSALCLYRGPNGLKCAAGIFIPDDQYDPEMDIIIRFKGVEDKFHVFTRNGIKFNDLEFLGELQHVHDMFFVDQWETELRYIAHMKDLSTKVFEEFNSQNNN